MDITMRMVVIAMISLAVAAIAMYMVQTERTNFMDFTDSQTHNADCSVLEAKWKRACCSDSDTTSIEEKADDLECDWWTYNDPECSDVAICN